MATLITGAGLIGCQTAALLAARGERVVLLDLRPDPALIGSMLPLAQVTLATGDVRDRAAMLALFEHHGVQAVLHTAAALSMAIRAAPTLAADVNFGGTVNLLEAARATGVRRFLLASSTTVHYPTFHRPWPAPIGEDFAFHAVSERPGTTTLVGGVLLRLDQPVPIGRPQKASSRAGGTWRKWQVSSRQSSS